MKERLGNINSGLEGDDIQPKNAWEVSLEDLPVGPQREAMESAGFSNKADWRYATEMGFDSADEFYKSLANKPYDQLTFREKGILEGINRSSQEAQVVEDTGNSLQHIENQTDQPLQLGFNPENSSLDYLDKLRQEAFAKGGADDADFAKYNQLYVEKLSDIKEKIEADKQNRPLALEYSGDNISNTVSQDSDSQKNNTQESQAADANANVEQKSETTEQEPETTEQNEYEKKFNEMLENGATAAELANYRRKIRANFIYAGEMTPEDEEMLKYMAKTSFEVGDKEREAAKNNKDTETNPDNKDTENNAEEKVERFQKFKKKVGNVIMKLLPIFGIGLAAYGTGYNNGKTADSVNTNNSGSEVGNKIKAEYSGASAKEFSKYANLDSSNAQEQEKNFNNGKYDSENNDYNKVDQKENQYSIGTSVAELSNEDFQKNMIESHSEDDIEYMGQFFVNDSEAAQKYLGMSNGEVDNLVDAARNGDQSAFQKLNEAYSNYMAGAKVVGQEALEGDYYSIFVNGDKNYAHSEGAFGGTARVVQLKNGQQILIRDQCKQLMMKKQVNVPSGWTTPTIPFEQTHTTPPPTTETPGKPVENTPGKPGENNPGGGGGNGTTPPPTTEKPRGDVDVEAKNPTVDINNNSGLNPNAQTGGQKFEVNTNEGNQQSEIQGVPETYNTPTDQADLNIQANTGSTGEVAADQGNVEIASQYRADGWANDTTSQTWENAYNNGGTQVQAQEGTNGSAGVNTGRVE